jgi:diguanylate cyclase (GGDEF)-like protein
VRVKVRGRPDDRTTVGDDGVLGERRADGPAVPPTWSRRVLAALHRPLACDDSRVAYWRRHVRIGVLLSEVSVLAVLVYAWLTPTGAHQDPVLLTLAAVVLVASPALLLLPLDAMLRDHRGSLLFYVWSIADTAVIAAVARIDGGAHSPLAVLMFLTLAFMAVAYPPLGVIALGGLMTVVYLLGVSTPGADLYAGFVAVVMAAFTMTCAMSSDNQWRAYDQQLLLSQAQQLLAETDPLTGCLNRRAFLERLSRAAGAVQDGTIAVVCLLDLDGFKAVNDDAGHAAGDAVLVAVSRALREVVRETDSVARLGGDEFALLAVAEVPACAESVAERARDVVARVGRGLGVTASVGVTTVLAADDVHDVLVRADTAMYRAKASGGDRTAALSRSPADC